MPSPERNLGKSGSLFDSLRKLHILCALLDHNLCDLIELLGSQKVRTIGWNRVFLDHQDRILYHLSKPEFLQSLPGHLPNRITSFALAAIAATIQYGAAPTLEGTDAVPTRGAEL